MPPEEGSQKKIMGMSRQTFFIVGGITVGGLLFLWYNMKKGKGQATGIAGIPQAMPTGAMDTTSGVSGTGVFNSLQDWMATVQRWASSMGFDAALTQNALQAYATGNCIDPSGYAILDQALSIFGMPPQAPYQGLVKCTPAPTPTPTPTPKPTPTPTPTFNKVYTWWTKTAVDIFRQRVADKIGAAAEMDLNNRAWRASGLPASYDLWQDPRFFNVYRAGVDQAIGTGASFLEQNYALQHAGSSYWHPSANGEMVFTK